MLRRIFGNIIPTIDRLIEKIPPHIRDIILKASLAFGALIALFVIIAGINKGLSDAKPAGFKLIENNRDLFYLQEMREEYAKKRKLVEDIEVDPLQFPSRQKAADETEFKPMGRDTMGHLRGEKNEMLQHDDLLRPKDKSPGYLGDSYQIPRLAPDKKTLEDGEVLLKKEDIGKTPPAEAPRANSMSELSRESLPKPASGKKVAERDIFDEGEKTGPRPERVSEKSIARPKKSSKLEFID